ncbi:MAG TPA: helix-turn-helix domain-containing protein [Gemmatimonadales bacterium]|nr:helix-turn-helix domain-containing protein [Gemmatimonadales bacterium]
MNLITTPLIAGAAQGFFLALILATKQTNTAANRILAAGMAAYSCFLLYGLYYSQRWYEAAPHFIGGSIPIVFLFGPLHYLYALVLSGGSPTVTRKSWLHFLPFVLAVAYLTPFFLHDGDYKLAFLARLMTEGEPLDLMLIEQLQFVQGIIYVILTILLLRRHQASLRDNFSSIERINLRWLTNLTIGIAAVWALATVMNVLDLLGIGLGGIEGSITPIGVAVLVYLVGYFGLRQPEIFHGRIGQLTPLPMAVPRVEPPQPAGYEKSGLDPAEAATLMERLRQLMQEKKPYLDSGLTLQDLAGELGISPHNLSEVINTQAGRNFYDFINQYRVEEAMARLRDPKCANLTILAIAGDAGFNSKATFNAFFKRQTGTTPSAFRKTS